MRLKQEIFLSTVGLASSNLFKIFSLKKCVNYCKSVANFKNDSTKCKKHNFYEKTRRTSSEIEEIKQAHEQIFNGYKTFLLHFISNSL